MNRTCNGDYFAIDGVWYYRCLSDGHVKTVDSPQIGELCSNCNRMTHGATVHPPEDIVVERVVILIACFPNGWRVRIREFYPPTKEKRNGNESKSKDGEADEGSEVQNS